MKVLEVTKVHKASLALLVLMVVQAQKDPQDPQEKTGWMEFLVTMGHVERRVRKENVAGLDYLENQVKKVEWVQLEQQVCDVLTIDER